MSQRSTIPATIAEAIVATNHKQACTSFDDRFRDQLQDTVPIATRSFKAGSGHIANDEYIVVLRLYGIADVAPPFSGTCPGNAGNQANAFIALEGALEDLGFLGMVFINVEHREAIFVERHVRGDFIVVLARFARQRFDKE